MVEFLHGIKPLVKTRILFNLKDVPKTEHKYPQLPFRQIPIYSHLLISISTPIASIDFFRYLHTVLSKNQVVSESNRSLLVETLRSIAEILIWGDQNDSSVFE